MKPEALTVAELAALGRIGERIRIIAALQWMPADRVYSYAEVVPFGVMTPDHVRSVVKEELAGMERGEELAEYVYSEVKIDGVPFREWAADPGVMRRG